MIACAFCGHDVALKFTAKKHSLREPGGAFQQSAVVPCKYRSGLTKMICKFMLNWSGDFFWQIMHTQKTNFENVLTDF